MAPSPNISDRGHLLTEQRLEASRDLDALPTKRVLELINEQDALVAGVVRGALPALEKLVEAVVHGFRGGGRLVYLGAGTSGRLGVLDASECPPTFFSDPNMVVGVIAGGDAALRRSSEGAEDDPHGARKIFEELDIGESDVVVGIAAGGTTPFVLGGLGIAKARGATTGLIVCADAKPQAADHVITLAVGPEVLTGSTRMKAGTATKMALNMLTTAAMVRMGKAWGNLMVDLRATNAKLLDRAARIISTQCQLDRQAALALLQAAGGRVKVALIMAKKNVTADQALRLLGEHGQNLRPLLGPPA